MKLSILILIFAGHVYAESTATQSTATTPSSSTTSGAAKTQQPSIYDAASQIRSANQAGQANASSIGTSLTTAGQALIQACCKPHGCGGCPVGIGLVIMGGMAKQQAGQHGGTAGGANFTMGDTDGYNGDGETDYHDGNKVGEGGFGGVTKEIAKDLKSKNIPVGFDGNKLVLPDGTKLGTDDFTSPSAMAAAGLNKGQIAAISAELAKAESKIKTVTPNFGYEEGGGGGAFGSKGPGAVDPDGSRSGGGLPGAGQADLSSMNAKEDAQGLSKNYHGEPIGVAGDSIFDMMARRYQLKNRQDTFFSGSQPILKK